MSDAYASVYKPKGPSVQEAIEVLVREGLLDDEEVGILNERLNPFQVTFDKDGNEEDRKKRESTPEAKAAAKKRAKNAAENRKKGPMAYDPYKSRAGESD